MIKRMPKRTPIENLYAAAGIVVKWQSDFGCTIIHKGVKFVLEGDGWTTHVRLGEAIAKTLGIPTEMVAYPIIPDDVYKIGSKTDSPAGDWKAFQQALKAEADPTKPVPKLAFLETRLGEMIAEDWDNCQAPFVGRAAKHYKPADDEVIRGEGAEATLYRGSLPWLGEQWLCPDLTKTPFWKRLTDVVTFKLAIHQMPTLAKSKEMMKKAAAEGKLASLEDVSEITEDEIDLDDLCEGEDEETEDNDDATVLKDDEDDSEYEKKVHKKGSCSGEKAKRGINVGPNRGYSSGIRSLFRRAMKNEAFIASLKSTNGDLVKRMSHNKTLTRAAAAAIKKWRCTTDEESPMEDLLTKIDEISRGRDAIAAFLFKQILTDFTVDPVDLAVVNRAALKERLEGEI